MRVIPVSCLLGVIAPSMQQLQQGVLVDGELLQRLTVDARDDARNKPTRKTHFDDGDQRAVRLEGGEASAQVIQLLHGALHQFTSAPMNTISSPPPHSISVGGTFTRWNGSYLASLRWTGRAPAPNGYQSRGALRARGAHSKADTAVARTIGIDTGKNTLHMIGLDEKGAIVLREKVSRTRIAT
jgi:hypothetical protein